jgi:DNA-binding transcriptional MerR regulator
MSDHNVRHLPRIGIGDAVRLYGFTPRAIRFYEERGLVEAKRDRLNVRYYDGVARRRLAWIAQLRRAGLSLQEIRAVLEAESTGGRGAQRAAVSLQSRRRALLAELRAVDEAMADLGIEPAEVLAIASA